LFDNRIVKLLAQGFKVFTVRGFGAGASFILTLLVTNNVSPGQAGNFFLCFAVINSIGMLFTLGSPLFLIRMIGVNQNDNWSYINQQFSLILKAIVVLGLSCILLTGLFGYQLAMNVFNKAELIALLPLTSVAILLFSLTQIFSAALQGLHLPVFASFVQNLVMPLTFIILISTAAMRNVPFGPYELIWFLVAGSCLAICFGFWKWVSDGRSSIRYEAGFSVELIRSLSPLFVISAVSIGAQWMGQIAVGVYLGSEQVAYFSTAQRTAMVISLVLVSINIIIAPKFAKAFSNKDLREVDQVALSASRLMIVIAIPLLVILLSFSELIMQAFGAGYDVAAPLLRIMVIGQFLNVVTGSVGSLLTMTGYARDLRNIMLFCGPPAIFLAFFLTKEYGMLGAAYGTAITVSTQNVIAVVFVKKRLGFNALNIFRVAK
jgi:O-antigen/teichoic acid export membrane protein